MSDKFLDVVGTLEKATNDVQLGVVEQIDTEVPIAVTEPAVPDMAWPPVHNPSVGTGIPTMNSS